jgi:hypothetical protein
VNKLDIQNLTLSGISHRCAQESDRFFNRKEHDPRFCYELFRRAILDQNQIAWDRILSQYQRLVTHWVERHAAFPGSGEEVQFFTNRAFEKMWIGISPKKFDKFTNLKSILKYLQMPSIPGGRRLARRSEDAHRPVQHRRHRDHEVQRVEPVEHAAVARDQMARVLDPGFALKQRLGEIADLGDFSYEFLCKACRITLASRTTPSSISSSGTLL